MIKVKDSNVHGRGVFSACFIPKGFELICDVIIIPKIISLPNELNIYTFPWNKTHYSICCGFASFFNHSDSPNVRNLKIDKENLKDHFITLTDINEGEEMFISYGPNPRFTRDIIIDENNRQLNRKSPR